MKKILVTVVMLMFGMVSAEIVTTPTVTQPTVTPATPQAISFANCTKMFAMDKEKLYYITLAAISANNFVVEEIQTYNGYVIFKAGGNKYLATVAEIDTENSVLKITPCNDIYVFPPGIVQNMFKYVELNKDIEIK